MANRMDHLHAGAVAAIAAYVLSALFAAWLLTQGIVSASKLRPETLSTLQWLVAQDRFVAPVMAVLTMLVLLLAQRGVGVGSIPSGRLWVWALAVFAFVETILISRFAFAGYALTLDEFMPEFQATIFRAGHVLAPLGDYLTDADRLQPFFTYVDAEHGLWGSNYRPGHAALLAIVPRAFGVSLLNPVLLLISVLALAGVSRRLFPDRPEMPVLAALMLLAWPQVMVTAGSGFAFSAHLALNLVWLNLFLRRNFWMHVLAALVGAYAIGLHQVHVHPLFAFPFLVGLLFGVFGRWVWVLPYAVVYFPALIVWISWAEIAVWLETGDWSVFPSNITALHYLADYLQYSEDAGAREAGFERLFLSANLLRFFSWASPVIPILGLAALFRIRHIGSVPIAALASILLTGVASHVLMANQMQGWGTRYLHPVIGCSILVALAGYDGLLRSENAAVTRRLVGGLILTSILVLVPWRAMQVAEKVLPRAEVQAALTQVDADVVVLAPMPVWYLPDFVRNDPFLENRPLLVLGSGDGLPGRKATLGHEDLRQMGLPYGTYYEPGN